MASPTQWTWVWVNSGSWWWTERPGMLGFASMGSQRVWHDWGSELNWTESFEMNLLIDSTSISLLVTVLFGSVQLSKHHRTWLKLTLAIKQKNNNTISLVVQWIGICLPRQVPGFNPWSRKISRAAEQLKSLLYDYWAHKLQSQVYAAREATTVRSLCPQQRAAVLTMTGENQGATGRPVQQSI